MDDMESKMGAILGNPEMMQKIMSMAQSLGATQTGQQTNQESKPEPPEQVPNIDTRFMEKLAGFAGQSRIDKNQQGLLIALRPYLNRDRISKLEKAMRAAKMASMASSLFANSGFLSSIGR